MHFGEILVLSAYAWGLTKADHFLPDLTVNVNAVLKGNAENLMGFYNFAPIGVLPAPYYWWETGGLFGSMIEYWHYTGDATFNEPIAAAIISQAGANNDFMMPQAEGNDDQGWWALAAMTAAEYGLPSPAGAPTWISLAQNVMGAFQSRWDTTRCNGGMKWKIQPGADGYHYKSTIANGLAFQLAARLARFTGDQSYTTWASTAYDWVVSVGLIDKDFNVFDGTDDSKGTGCIDVNHDQWSYNVGAFLMGAAVMFDVTKDPAWSNRTSGLLSNAKNNFFKNNIMYEKICEPTGSCNVDQLSFKAYLARWMANVSTMMPSLQQTIMPLVSASAEGAKACCTGGGNGQMCGSRWDVGFDGSIGVGQQMSALDVMRAPLSIGVSKPMRAARKIRRTFIA